MANRYEAGIATAYGAALRGGYTGTYAEFCAQQAQYAKNAQDMEQSAERTGQQATAAQNARDDAARAAAEARAYALGSNQGWTNSSGQNIIINPGTTYWTGADGKDKNVKTGAKTFAELAADEARYAETQKAAATQSAAAAAQSAAEAGAKAESAAEYNRLAGVNSEAATQAKTAAERAKLDAQALYDNIGPAVDQALEDIEAKKQESLASIPADYTTLDRLQQLQAENIPGTVQKFEFSGGNVQKVIHQQGETAVRTDVFTYSGETITETRTLATGEKLEIVTNLSTLETTTAYTAA